jgi:hypothetical protein
VEARLHEAVETEADRRELQVAVPVRTGSFSFSFSLPSRERDQRTALPRNAIRAPLAGGRREESEQRSSTEPTLGFLHAHAR